MTSKMDIRAYKPADETFYDYKDEEETPRGTHHNKEDDEDINNSTVGRYASGEDFKHWPFKVGNAMTDNIPKDIDWLIQVEGHTDKNPINTLQFPSNWELSTARANTVLKLLLNIGFEPKRLSAAGYGEFYPITEGESPIDFQQNRRIELKLTSR